MMIYPYKGYDVVQNCYGHNEYTVQYCGDDYYFTELDEAFKFIDEINE